MPVTVLSVIAVVLVVLLAYAATKPDSYGIERIATVHAPAEKIFPLIVDLRQWPKWSPFEALDPAMKRTYSGVATETGAVYEWYGNSRAGRGRMEITKTTAPAHVSVQVDFVKPFVAHNVNHFALHRDGGATRVTWAMRGTQPYMLKLMSIFVSPDRLLGKHFETGL